MPSQLPFTLMSSENVRHSLNYSHVTQKGPGKLPPDPDLSLGTTKAEAGGDEHLVFAPRAVIVRVSEGRGGFPCAPTFSSSAHSVTKVSAPAAVLSYRVRSPTES